MQIVKVDESNHHVYMNLSQAYAAEFSKLIQEKPDSDGLFEIYPKIEGNVIPIRKINWSGQSNL